MTEPFDQGVNRFTEYIESHLQEISQIKSQGEHVLHYKRVLYVTVLDALAKVVFPSSGNRQRMVSFLSSFSNWKEYDRISLPHLVKLLKLAPEPALESLRLFAINEFSNWTSGDVIPLSRDPSYQEIRNLWPKDNEYKFPIKGINKEISLESLQHVNLFYNHRNSLVHEFRMLGLLSGAPISSKNEPYYSALIFNFDEDGEEDISWELEYPLQFYEKITKNCLVNLSEYMMRNQINPFSFFTSGSYWINELNV